MAAAGKQTTNESVVRGARARWLYVSLSLLHMRMLRSACRSAMNDGANVVVPLSMLLPTLLLLADNYATMKAITMPEQCRIKKKRDEDEMEWKKRKQSVIMRSLSVVQLQRRDVGLLGCFVVGLLAAAATHNQVIMERTERAALSLRVDCDFIYS